MFSMIMGFGIIAVISIVGFCATKSATSKMVPQVKREKPIISTSNVYNIQKTFDSFFSTPKTLKRVQPMKTNKVTSRSTKLVRRS